MRKWEPIELLRHVRHDWLNRLQLIKGYQALGKTEKVKEIIDHIILSTDQESKLSSINLPKLALLLITYNWESPSFVLNYEVIGEGEIKNINDHFITQWFDTFFKLLNEYAFDEEENELNITINIFEEKVSFIIEFYGILKEKKQILCYLQEKNNLCQINNIHVNDEAFSFELKPRI
ncbi:sporulation initiation phosphotransferase B [Pallidibacillus thermolactis]|jgi:stage 0 sporulation protein B (sporulation initiation phosphotransferase)|uniref:sporulation initiation phosphotransferase B n=1 Tax=Pallidibacillus thermolactis TaxID=251051 RepID=UPI0021DAC570|nr:sporulation initiation phosphotransferase B [Pallidibacillus thermolactis]MCU9601859.1 sporulation initiation phosphotransferase B [Pallidibacillus thermolactis subsp. kokeshiiformis]MED1673762.1 sporulation initiation phosphotransferase B [Pallidibacillus thermolactis subsp. kokeshiiformis]